MDDVSFGTYRELAVWQKAVRLVKLVYAQIAKFPAEERYALADQARRSVMSIPANIAEGNGRASNRDYAHFLSISRGSLYETINHLDIAESLGYISHSEEIESLAIELRKMLFSMIKKFSPATTVQPSTSNLSFQPPLSNLQPSTSNLSFQPPLSNLQPSTSNLSFQPPLSNLQPSTSNLIP